jgi:cyclic pyranopterin phosphate synthase
MAAKNTANLIPLCHQINLSKVDVRAEIVADGVFLEAEAKTDSQTGVEWKR